MMVQRKIIAGVGQAQKKMRFRKGFSHMDISTVVA